MYEVLGQMGALIVCGVVWRWLRPMGLEADPVRQALTSLVYVLLLPALVLLVLWQAPLDVDVLRVAVVAGCTVLAGLGLAVLVYHQLKTPRRTAGALILAAGFPNATYMGLPVLEQVFGPWARSIAIQYDLFACTPLLLTVGALVAQRYGEGGTRNNPVWALLKVPPLWAAVAALALNLGGVAMPHWCRGLLGMMGGAVVPLMLIAVGLSLRLGAIRWKDAPLLAPALALRLLALPLLAWGLALGVGLGSGKLPPVVLEAAMPSMVLGLVFCDRYRLDTGLYATTVTVSTLLSVITLPLWFAWLH